MRGCGKLTAAFAQAEEFRQDAQVREEHPDSLGCKSLHRAGT